MRRIFGLRGRRLVVAAAAIFALAAGIAYAAIPDANGTYHACMLKTLGTIRIVDPATQRCNATLETAIAFGQKGDQGLQGPAGASPTVAPLPVGDGHCSAGGAAITDAAGGIAYVCSGRNGQDGVDGEPFSGTFTSPNGQYSIAATDSGVTLSGPSSSVTVSGTGVRVDTHGSDSVVVMSSGDLTLRSGTTASVRGSVGLSLRSDATASLAAGAALALQGSTVRVGGSGSCAPAARLGDDVAGSATPDGAVLGSIVGGAPSVCIG
jgi:hypothetical protein